MEKDKGLFSFRKRPVRNFPDGKKGRKRKGCRLRRSMGFLLAAALIFNTLPASGLAVSASEQKKGLCEHHRSHTAECGYKEAQACGYVCEICNGTKPEDTENNAENDTENAGTDTAECICETLCTGDSINGDCPVCGAEDADLSHCKGEKTEEQEKTGKKVITAWEWIDPEEYLTDGMLALPGAGRENPEFAEDVTALLPEKIIARGQTALSDVVTYKEDGTTPANTFSVGETIIVKATATFPANNAIMAAAEFDTPTAEQMAVYYNDTQISAPLHCRKRRPHHDGGYQQFAGERAEQRNRPHSEIH